MNTWQRMVGLATQIELCLDAAGRKPGSTVVSWCPVGVFATDTGCCDHLIVHPAQSMSTGNTTVCGGTAVRFDVLVVRCVHVDRPGPIDVNATPDAPGLMEPGSHQFDTMSIAFDLDLVVSCLNNGCAAPMSPCSTPTIVAVTRECGTNCQGFRVTVEYGG